MLDSMINYPSGELRASNNWPYALAAGCVVYRKSPMGIEVLLLSKMQKTDPTSAGDNLQSYHLPKGHAKIGETLETTAQRETEEEAGCVVEIQTYLGSLHWKYVHSQYPHVFDKTVHSFLALWKKDQGEMDQEHDARLWVPIQKAKQLLGAKSNPKGEDELISRAQTFFELSDES